MDRHNGYGYLKQHGESLIDNGYNIVPIEPNKKAPGFDGWQKTRSSQSILTKWLESGKEHHGVGIITAHTPAVDIDVLDEELAAELEAWCHEHLGQAPVRVGLEPKRLLLYRTDEPFRKITSKTYLNEWNERCRIEILGDGQQFVAFHTHPETHKPYHWTSEKTPANTPAGELPMIDVDKVDELIELFEKRADELGWKEAKAGRLSTRAKVGQIDRDDPFAADTQPITITTQELQSRLMMVPGADDYDTWLQIGMALFHQFDGEDLGREMWHEWSETADNYDQDALERKWKTFDISEKGRAPVTARLILRMAKEAAESKAIETTTELRDLFSSAKDRSEWNEAAKQARKAEIDHLSRASLADLARSRLEAITGAKVPLVEVKKSLAYEINSKELPRWCRDWVYDVSDDKFFNILSKYTVSPQGFNAMNDRHAMTKKDVLDGKTSPASSASQLALNFYKIPAVNGRMYAPGRDPVFTYNDSAYANTYPENQVPPKVKTIRPVDQKNIKRIRRHLEHLLADERERRILLDWLSWVVQNPGKKVNWAILLQGVQGDGKSFFAFLLRAVMGAPNVRMGNAHILEGSFTGWAQGQCVMAIEEVRLVGHNRYDITNRIKPLITNPIIEVHPKGRDPYNVENTTNYLLFTNYRDALPLSDNERRYCVLFSRWQDKEQLATFLEDEPDYYVELYAALEESAPALRSWLLQLEQDDSFKPQGNAPLTQAFRYMVTSSQPTEMRSINELIESEEYHDVSDELLNVTRLYGLAMSSDFEMPQTRMLEKMLENAGFWPLGRVKIGETKYRFYSKSPSLFSSMIGGEMSVDTAKIRKFLKEREPDDDDDL